MNSGPILLVEDNQSDIALTQRAFDLNRIANELVVIEDGQSALDYLFGEGIYAAAHPSAPLPALVLLDLKLPKVDGIEVLRQLRARPQTRRLPIVVLTSSREEPDLAAAYDLGVNSYIRKPVDFQQFNEAIKQLGLYWLVWNESPPRPSGAGDTLAGGQTPV